MRGLRNRIITFISLIILTMAMSKNVYADIINAPQPPVKYDYLSMFWTIDIILIVCIFAIIILVKLRHKK